MPPVSIYIQIYSQIFKHLVSDLVGNPECRFSHVYAHICFSTAKSINIHNCYFVQIEDSAAGNCLFDD